MLIDLEGIEKVYEMEAEDVRALRGVDLEIEGGEYAAIMGPSGSGKSTLMNIIGCLDTPSAGTYRLNGTDVSEMNPNELADVRNQQIGFVFDLHRQLTGGRYNQCAFVGEALRVQQQLKRRQQKGRSFSRTGL